MRRRLKRLSSTLRPELKQPILSAGPMLPESARTTYAAGECEIDLTRRELRVQGAAVPIGGRAFEIIQVLVQSAGQLVTKDELMDRIWPGAIVNDNTLQVHISAVRKALGSRRALLKTESGRGYRLLGDWAIQHPRPTGAGVISFPQLGSTIALPPLQAAKERPATNFPVLVTDLVGRCSALRLIRELLSAYRVVTLTGPGGIGKTTLALHTAQGICANFDDGNWLVELASLSDPNLVPSAVATALGLRLGDIISAESVARAIGVARLLLLLDNCEHVIDAVTALAETLVGRCPRVAILATSREALRIAGEHVYRVPPLDVPAPTVEKSRDLLAHSSIELFITRMQTLDSSFVPDAATLPVVAEICRHLDGLPLAIEFAAARAVALGVRVVADELGNRFALLTGGHRTALPRHQTLRATLDWSYDLLSEAEQHLLCDLAVFAGRFTLEAAAAVSGAPHTVGSLAELIANLVVKSLVVFEGSVTPSEWRLLETTRTYASGKLAERGDLPAAARRHAEYYNALFATAETESEARPRAEWLAAYGHHLDDIRAALDWAFSADGAPELGVTLTVAAVPLWLHLSLFAECLERVHRAAATLAADTAADRRRIKLSTARATSLYSTKGAVDGVRTAWEETLDLAEQLDETDYLLRALWGLWSYSLAVGDYRAADALGRRFQQAASRSKNTGDQLIAERMIGGVQHFLGNQTDARTRIEAMLSHYDEALHRPNIVRFHYDQRMAARVVLARILWVQGFPEQAMRAASAAVDQATAGGLPVALCFALNEAAIPVAMFSGDWELAERHLETLRTESVQHDFAVYHARAIGSIGVLTAKRGDPNTGVRMIRDALHRLDTTGSHAYPMLLGNLADALGALGDIKEGSAHVDTALARCERTGERWYIAELLRIKGELTLKSSDPAAPSAGAFDLIAAIDWARRQSALSWELRAATTLARLRQSQRETHAARDLLEPVYGRFTEGFGTADLKKAKALLAELA